MDSASKSTTRTGNDGRIRRFLARHIAHHRGLVESAAVLALVPFATAMSQRVGGIVHEVGTGVPIAGAVVSALDSTGGTATRTITNESGRFELQWRPPVQRLRVVRIGYRPASVALVLNAPRDTSIDIAMDRIPVTLDTIRAKKDATCSNSPDRVAALDLWEQARTALLASVVARTGNSAEMTLLSYERRFDPADQRTTGLQTRVMSGTSNTPYIVVPTVLTAQGYRATEGAERLFHGPDVDVLFDDGFAAAHCLGIALDGSHPGQIGMTFEPAPHRGGNPLVDVRGVLWIDRRAPALTELEFRFTDVSTLEDRSGAGGAIHFQSMPNGVVFADRWSTLLPLIVVGIGPPRIVGMKETGGAVVDATWPNGMVWRTPLGTVQGRVTERQTNAPIAGAWVALDGGLDTVMTDGEGRFLFSIIPPGRYGLRVADTAMAEFVRARTTSRDVQVARNDTVTANVEFPSHATLAADQCKGPRTSAETSTILGRVGDGGGSWPRNLVVESTWKPGSASDASNPEHQTSPVDDKGRFFVCGVGRDRPVQMRIVVGKLPIADTSFAIGRDDLIGHIEWALRPGRLAGASSAGEGTLSGRVVREGDGSPIPDAEVWAVLGGVRVRTDSAGRFRFYGLRPGPEVVQVRQIGFTMRTDTVSLRKGQETTKQLRMSREVVSLDTMRVTVDSVHYFSPTMRAFESRRAKAIGHFIAEEELRKSEDRSLDNLILKNTPGVQFVPSRTGTESYAASMRAGAICLVRVMIDGLPIYNGPPDPPFDIRKVQVRDLGGVEYYSSATTPAQFATMGGTDCGLLMLWTRER